jgi:hypothetical protein
MTTTRARRRTALAAPILAGVLVLAGCSGDDPTDETGSGTASGASSDVTIVAGGEATTAEGLAAAGREMLEKLIEPDYGAAFARLSDRCQVAVPAEEFIAQATRGAELAENMGIDLSTGVITDVQTRDVTETSGEVFAMVEVEGRSDQFDWAPFVYEDGTWRLDDCGGPEADAP